MIDKVDKLAGSFSEIIKLLYATTQELVNKNGFQYTEVLVGLYFVTKIHREAAYNHLMKLKTTEKEAAAGIKY